MPKITEHGLAGKFLASIGLLVILGELALHFIAYLTDVKYELNEAVILIGALLGFVGFWIIDPKKTKDGATVIGDFVPRFGRRKTDPVAIPLAETTVAAVPPVEEKRHD